MRYYELLFILRPTLTEEESNTRLEFVKELFNKHNANIASIIPMGTRKLAYSIKKYQRGTYFVFYFTSEPSFLLELQRVLGINEDIIRFLIVKYESKREIDAWGKLCTGYKYKFVKKTRKENPKEERSESKVESKLENKEDNNV